jgi:hypothetical protein
MAYIHCISGQIIEFKHNLDNTIEGKFSTSLGEISFKSRGHVVKTTNKIYQNNAWKPAMGLNVLFDGDLVGDFLILDHVEIDQEDKINKKIKNKYTDVLLGKMKTLPVATKEIRYNSRDNRFRFAEAVSRQDHRGNMSEEILHAAYSDDGWKFWTVTKKGGKISATSLDDESEIILARAVGLGSEKGLTVKEAQEEERKKRTAIKAKVVVPFDDCPF